jgi:hypothetical protein
MVVLKRLKQEDHEFKAGLDYIPRSCLPKPLPFKKKKKNSLDMKFYEHIKRVPLFSSYLYFFKCS